MKRSFLTLLILASALTVAAQQRKVMLPGKGNIDVEQLNGKIDLTQDISRLSISETRVLRNAFAARQGYCLMSADLRSIYNATTWYDSIMNERWWKENEEEITGEAPKHKATPVGYTRGELNFIKKLQAHEIELRKQNFKTAEGERVNIDNLINPFQMDSIPQPLRKTLARNGFAIVPTDFNQLFQIYENNDYHDFPNFVTTDLYLQAFHIYFDSTLRDLEIEKFDSLLTLLCHDSHARLTQIIATQKKNKKTTAAAKYLQAYFAVAMKLLNADSKPVVAKEYQKMVDEELTHVKNAKNDYSKFLEYKDVPFGYDIFRPRGHYTRSEQLGRYFRAMMWLQTVPFGTDKRQQLERAVVLAETIATDGQLSSLYNKIFRPLTYLMGKPDNVTILQLYDIVKAQAMPTEAILKKAKAMDAVKAKVEELAERQTKIRPHFQRTSRYKINFMPQRYQPDALVLQEMVDYESPVTKRDVPRGLDIMAAMGMSEAERILISEMNEATRWSKYTENLNRMKDAMAKTDWDSSLASKWVKSLQTLQSDNAKLPYFMQTPQWEKKNLNTALASWAELKHDAILYAKQPMGAECGGYGPPDPVLKSYVEPNVAFWEKAVALVDETQEIFRKFNLETEKSITASRNLREQAEFLLKISQKELANQTITDEEYKSLEIVGSSFEAITLDLIRDKGQWLDVWNDVDGADKKVSLIADVYTANADNNPKKSVLYEAVGPAHTIYVVVEMGGYLYITRGAVLSYREFQEDISAPRITDEEWQQQLETQPDKGIPSWMKEVIVPIGDKLIDNEWIFYSSGC